MWSSTGIRGIDFEGRTTAWNTPTALLSELLVGSERLAPIYLFSSFIERLLPICEVDWLRAADPDSLTAIQEYYREDEISDQEYLDYENDKHRECFRHRYYPDCLLVGKSWSGEGEMVLLNSRIVFPNGEWEGIFFAD